MNYKKHLKEIREIRKNSSNITEAAKAFCKKHNVKYTDNVRRAISNLLKENKKTLKASKKTWKENFSDNTAYFEGTVETRIKTLDDAIKVSGADLDIWEVERWLCNSWETASKYRDQDLTFSDGVMTGHATRKNEWIKTTNFQIKVWFKRKERTLEDRLKDVLPVIKKYSPKKIKKSKGNGVGVVSFADFHIGAEVKNLLKTKDFDMTILLDYIHKAVDKINKRNYSEVHVNLLGDFFESLSGMNHENTFKSLGKGMWGANVIILANEVIGEHLLSNINNLVGVNIVSGNHDRMTASNKLDNTGEGGKVLWYMLTKDFPDLPITYHNSVIAKEIDSINYLLTHGDKGYSKKDFSKFVLDYGDTEKYNLVIEGHLHTRKTLKSMSVEKKYYQEQEVVSYDDSNYRKLVAPSLFTGNWYSESLGFGGNAGMIITENNGSDNVNVFDYTL